MLEARLAEMHLRVDDPRQDVEAPAVDRLTRGRRTQVADRRDAFAAHADVGAVDAVVVDDRAVLEDRVVVRHVSVLSPLAALYRKQVMPTIVRPSRALFRFSGPDAQDRKSVV